MDNTPQISRSGRVLKKSAKVKEMEDLDINDFEAQGKPKKKIKGIDDFDEFDDKRVAPIKIPKISLNVATSPVKKKPSEMPQSLGKIPSFPSPVKSKLDMKTPLFQESSPEQYKDSDSSSASSETSTSSSSSSEESDSEVGNMHQKFSNLDSKPTLLQNIQRLPNPPTKMDSYRQFDSPMAFVDHHNDVAMDASEDETSESNLVIAEESNDSPSLMAKGQKAAAARKRPVKKDSLLANKAKVQRKKPPPKEGRVVKKKKPEGGRSKPLTAYMLWCTENRKRIAAQGNSGFASIGKRMGEAWQALSDKEKMAWRRKAKKLALKGSSLISTGPSNDTSSRVLNHNSSSLNDDLFKNLGDTIRTAGTSPIDSAAYLKLLGESLSVIGQRLTEHEGQLAVSGIFSVLLDSILCVIAPLLCLTAETPVLNSCPQEVCRRTLDNIAYFMPGL